MKIEQPNKKTISKEMLPQIVERIFSICKTDSNFPLKDKLSDVDSDINSIQLQIDKQDKLLKQSKKIKSDILTRLANLRKSNQELKERLLDSLGSEL